MILNYIYKYIGKYRLVRLGVFKIIIFFKNYIYIYIYMNKNRAFFNTIFDIRHLGYFRHWKFGIGWFDIGWFSALADSTFADFRHWMIRHWMIFGIRWFGIGWYSALDDSALDDSALDDSAFADSAFADSAFVNMCRQLSVQLDGWWELTAASSSWTRSAPRDVPGTYTKPN
jgi:hypothetical protein